MRAFLARFAKADLGCGAVALLDFYADGRVNRRHE
jgi:hypothetical protein